MIAFVTGGSGFVGSWLCDHLRQEGDEVIAPETDVTDASAIAQAVAEAAPEAIYHLAGLAHVGDSWKDPAETFRVNALGTLHVLQAAITSGATPTLLIVSSAAVYGDLGADGDPITEDAPLRPASPYAASKVAAEYLGLQAHLGEGLPVVTVRPFNQVGPGQLPDYVVSALARRIASAERSGADTVSSGPLDARRDLTDVRDAVRAYRLLVARGVPGEVYNLCSGTDVSIAEVADRLLAMASRPLELVPDPALDRKVDVSVQRGDCRKLRETTGWEPRFSLEESLRDVLAHWRAEPTA